MTRYACGISRRFAGAFVRSLFAILLLMQFGGNAFAFSRRDYPSFNLKIFGYDAAIFYRPSLVQGGLSTTIGIDQRHENDVAPSKAEELQRRIDGAYEVELSYAPDSGVRSSNKVDLLTRIPSPRPFGVFVNISLQRTPFVGEIGNAKILSEIERVSDDPDKSHFDDHGYRLVPKPVPNLVMQRSRYSRPNGRPLFFLRHKESSVGPAYAYLGSFLYGKRARVTYYFRYVQEEHWIDVDKAVLAFVATVLALPKAEP